MEKPCHPVPQSTFLPNYTKSQVTPISPDHKPRTAVYVCVPATKAVIQNGGDRFTSCMASEEL